MRTGRRPELTPSQHYVFLRMNPVCVGTGRLSPTGLVWEYRVRPTPLSREYLVRIAFDRGDVPVVRIIQPDLLKLAGGRPLPHVYHNPLRLCLILPGTQEWIGTMRIDQTFVPWAATWLFYFEEWLASNEWKGDGQHPDENDAEQYNRSVRRAVRRPT